MVSDDDIVGWYGHVQDAVPMVEAESFPSWDLFSRVQIPETGRLDVYKIWCEGNGEALGQEDGGDGEGADRKVVEMDDRMLVMVSFSSLIGIVSRYIGRTRPF